MQIFKSWRIVALCLVAMLGCMVHPVQAQQFPAVVSEALKQAGIAAGNVGIFVQDVASGESLLSLNANERFNPASVMKLVTTGAALELLGPTFYWSTQAYTGGALNGGVLDGDLSIKGSGDPKLVLESLWLFLRQIRAKGVRDIRGNVVLDRGVFGESVYDPAQFDGDPARPYNVGADALLLNYKTIAFRFFPDAAGQLSVTTEPPLATYAIVAPKQVTNGSCGDWKGKLQADVGTTSTVFKGVYPVFCGEKI